MRIFHIDNGRKYFSLDQLKRILKVMGENGYDMIELSVGNGGMRFLLDDMTIKTGAKTYDSESVKKAINAGNKAYCDNGTNELTEQEMEELVESAKKKKISIMPLLNSPGHMEAIVTAMENLGIKNVRYKGSASTIDFDNIEAVEFTKELVKKYVEWFKCHGSTYFNMGCDEYANDVLTSGFAALCNQSEFRYDRFVEYINETAGMIKKFEMKPVMFNDGVYYNENTQGGVIDQNIIVSYWSTGWPGYTPAAASFVQRKGHKIINTSANWYYVLGRRRDGKKTLQFTDEDSFEGIEHTGKKDIMGGSVENPIGEMLCLWTDEPEVIYSEQEEKIIFCLLERFAAAK